MWQFDSGSYPGTWTEVSSPVSVALYDAAQSTNGPCAVGAKGFVIGRTPDGEWGILVEDGPAGRNQKLLTVTTSDDGKRIWFGGTSGALGCYDIPTGERMDFSEPDPLNGTIGALTVAGNRGEEKMLVADTSGNVLPAYYMDDEAEIDWEWASRPSGDTTIQALAADTDGYGFAVSNNAEVFKTTPDEGWERIGIADAANSLYEAYIDGEVVLVGGGSGFVYEREEDDRWTPHNLGNFAVRGLTREGEEMLAGGSNHIMYRKGNNNWVDVGWKGGNAITGTLIGTDGHEDVAVGKGGTIVEGVRDQVDD